MVAILGPIIAAPFARPRSVTAAPPIDSRIETSLGRESVVRIALDTSANADSSAESEWTTVFSPASILSIGS